jgi:uncharacterized membrane protein
MEGGIACGTQGHAMAEPAAKTLLVLLGVLAILGGLGAAAYGYEMERREGETGEGGVPELAQDDGDARLIVYGLVVAGFGFVLVILGTAMPSRARVRQP